MKKLTTEIFIERSKEIHGNKYDYSLVDYINSKTKVKIICPKHGIFEQLPDLHLSQQQGCKKCANNSKKTTEEYINNAKKIHNNKYNYSLVKYNGCKSKIKIICPEHCEFIQRSDHHLKGAGCKICSNCYSPTTKEFIEKATKIHNNKYDYSIVNYVNNQTKIKIICSEHGVFEQTPLKHISGQGCKKCAGNMKSTREEFIEKSNKIHDNRYDYSLVKYKHNKYKVEIICKQHGIFKQTPSNHLLGNGCPICKSSYGEKSIINFLKTNNIIYNREKTFENLTYKNKLKFDFFLPKYNLCIEYDGKQHFEPNEFFGGKKGFKETQKRDQMKNEYCKENNIHLIRIRYDEDINEKLKFLL